MKTRICKVCQTDKDLTKKNFQLMRGKFFRRICRSCYIGDENPIKRALNQKNRLVNISNLDVIMHHCPDDEWYKGARLKQSYIRSMLKDGYFLNGTIFKCAGEKFKVVGTEMKRQFLELVEVST